VRAVGRDAQAYEPVFLTGSSWPVPSPKVAGNVHDRPGPKPQRNKAARRSGCRTLCRARAQLTASSGTARQPVIVVDRRHFGWRPRVTCAGCSGSPSRKTLACGCSLAGQPDKPPAPEPSRRRDRARLRPAQRAEQQVCRLFQQPVRSSGSAVAALLFQIGTCESRLMPLLAMEARTVLTEDVS